MKFTLLQLEEVSKNRPQGYKQEVLAASKKISDDLYELPEDAYKILFEKYRLPSRLQMVKNLIGAMADLAEDPEQRSKDEIEKCLNICAACPHMIDSQFRCGICGCFLTAKTKFKSWHCPIKKW